MTLPSLQHVLATTDLSPRSDRALPYAFALAGRRGRVHLMHVIEPVRAPNPLYAHYAPSRTPTPEERAAQLEAIRAELRSRVPEEAAELEIEVDLEVVEDQDVAEALCRAAERLGVDALCMGSHGRGGLAAVWVGSVARDVVQCARRPVLVVRTGDPD